jgi:hypothetical protein
MQGGVGNPGLSSPVGPGGGEGWCTAEPWKTGSPGGLLVLMAHWLGALALYSVGSHAWRNRVLNYAPRVCRGSLGSQKRRLQTSIVHQVQDQAFGRYVEVLRRFPTMEFIAGSRDRSHPNRNALEVDACPIPR